jgi:hypothetical protein
MAQALCDQLSIPNLGGSAVAGLGGASAQIRSVEKGGRLRIARFTFTVPASGAGSASADTVLLPAMGPLDRIYMLRFFVPGSLTFSVGKVDSNNSANSDPAHYIPNAVYPAGMLDAVLNMGEQVGVDPTGASTDTGDKPIGSAPGGGFGNGPVNLQLTWGASPTAALQIQGFFVYTPGA